jgi:hypothetical protein
MSMSVIALSLIHASHRNGHGSHGRLGRPDATARSPAARQARKPPTRSVA